MKKQENGVVATFYTTAAAMEWEAACRAAGIEGKLISTPREFSADCGIAWRSPAGYRETLETLAGKQKLETERICEER